MPIDTILFCSAMAFGQCQDTNTLVIQHHPARIHYNGEWLRVYRKPDERNPSWGFVVFHRDPDGQPFREEGTLLITPDHVTIVFDERGMRGGKRLK
jgi:hypothetical protein